ncbi:MAG: hypothetical protein BKP49_09295 [Treponema sp. CETP13]|nr:MAG: hypothetical protein BKP49_09295 [Treponema sp. CETP13]
MKIDEKKILYNLLETSNAYINKTAKSSPPHFTDDFVEQSKVLPSNPVKPTENKTTLEYIAQQIATCQRCQLSKTRHYTVPGNGVEHPLVLIIGEGPGEDEDLSSQPFVGRAGQLLDKMMAAIQLSKTTNVFISNIVKCRPPHNRNPEPQESEACRSWLDSQIILLQPKAILALGKVASHNLLGISDTMSKMHGQFYNYRGIPVMPTYHPSALLRNESMKRPAWEDLKKLRAELLKMAPGYTDASYYTLAEHKPKMAYPQSSVFNNLMKQIPRYNN